MQKSKIYKARLECSRGGGGFGMVDDLEEFIQLHTLGPCGTALYWYWSHVLSTSSAFSRSKTCGLLGTCMLTVICIRICG